jgi:multiple sugar transport system permease protein
MAAQVKTRNGLPRRRKKIRPTRILLYITLLAVSCICLVPLYWMLRSSLMSNAEIFVFPPRFFPKEWRWNNYIKTFENFDALLYLGNTMKLLIPCVVGTVLTSAMAGYALGRIRFTGRNFWFMLVIGSMILPGHVVLIPQYLTYSKLGMINTYWPFYLGAWFGGGAANIFLMRQFMVTLPKDYDEAAFLDGARRIQIFFKIILPLCMPILITVAIFSFMHYWNDFQGPLIYLQSDKKFTLALGILTLRGAYSSKWNYIMAASLVMVVPALVLFAIGQRYFIEGIVLTGVKG